MHSFTELLKKLFVLILWSLVVDRFTGGILESAALGSTSQELRKGSRMLLVPLKIGKMLLLHVSLIEFNDCVVTYFDVINRHDLVIKYVLDNDRLYFRDAHSHRLCFSLGALLIVHWGSHFLANYSEFKF